MTQPSPILSALYRYPVKSMAGDALNASAVSRLGLPFDRMWMVADRSGRFVTGRQLPQLVRVRTEPSADGVTLTMAGRSSGERPTASATAKSSDSTIGRPDAC